MAKIIGGHNCETNLEGANIFATVGEKAEQNGTGGLSGRAISFLRRQGFEGANQKRRDQLMDMARKIFIAD